MEKHNTSNIFWTRDHHWGDFSHIPFVARVKILEPGGGQVRSPHYEGPPGGGSGQSPASGPGFSPQGPRCEGEERETELWWGGAQSGRGLPHLLLIHGQHPAFISQ